MHKEIQSHLDEDDLQFTFCDCIDGEKHCEKIQTSIVASFECKNKLCRRGKWGSRKVNIKIRMYRENRYTVKVYHQHCMRCGVIALPILEGNFTGNYAGRVSFWLKTWSGIDVKQPDEELWPPMEHKDKLCEGCLNGTCHPSEKYKWNIPQVVRKTVPGLVYSDAAPELQASAGSASEAGSATTEEPTNPASNPPAPKPESLPSVPEIKATEAPSKPDWGNLRSAQEFILSAW